MGRAAASQFAGLDVGNRLRWGQNEWTVVGVFAAGGGLAESEIWCDAGVLQPAYRRGDSFQSVYARLESPEAFQPFKDALTSDPRLDVKVIRESEYYAAQSEGLTTLIRALGIVITFLMGLGAVFGSLNTMYAAVATRTREIATLRALGFRAGPVVLSVLAESLVPRCLERYGLKGHIVATAKNLRENVIVATGHSMMGMSLGPIFGRLVLSLSPPQPNTQIILPGINGRAAFNKFSKLSGVWA